ncbi:MAG: MMPL family transporter [Chitinivibrionales bacterium]|nr:MMPL family transporter [Chitinivibrionales bacterium]
MNSLFKKYLNYKKTILVFWIVCVIVSGSGIFRLTVTHEHTSFFSQSNKRFKQQQKLQRSYRYNGNLLFCVVPDSGDIFTPRTLQCIDRLETRIRELPYASLVQSVTSYKKTVMGLGGLTAKNLIDLSDTSTTGYLDKIKKTITSDPLAINRLVSSNGHAAGIVVYFDIPDSIPTPTKQIATSARGIIKSLSPTYPDIRLYVTGGYMLDEAFAQASFKDIRLLLPLMYLIMIIALWFILHDTSTLLAVIAVVLGSSLTAMGFAGWLGIVLTPPSSIAPIIILTVGIADCIHIVISFFHAHRPGTSQKDAVLHALRKNSMPVFITSATTLIGFAGLNFSEVPPFRDLGTIVGIGIVAAFLLTMTLLPLMLISMPIKARPPRWGRHDLIGTYLGTLITAHSNKLLLFTAAIAFTCILGLRRIEFNDMFIDYFDSSFTFKNHTEAVMENLTGLDYIECSFTPPPGTSISDTSYLDYIDNFCSWARSYPGVVHVAGISDVLKLINRQLHGGDTAYYRLGDPSLIKSILEQSHSSSAQKAGMSLLVGRGKNATRVIVTVGKISAKELRMLEQKIKNRTDHTDADGITAVISSISLLFAHISEHNIRSMARGIGITLIAIFVFLSILGRAMHWGIIGLFPNIVTLLMAIGLWGIITGEAGLATSIVAAMSLGIIVDDTIHLLYAFMAACTGKCRKPTDAVHYAMRHTADAIVFTSLILAAGFGILSFSGFRPTAHMGILTTIILIFAAAADLFLFTPILMFLPCSADNRKMPGNGSIDECDQQ